MKSMKPADLSKEYWNGMSPEHRDLYLLVRPQPRATYAVDFALNGIEKFLGDLARDMDSSGGVLELIPDFQRGHVWTGDQPSRYVESLIRGVAPRAIKFNCPGWQSTSASTTASKGDIPPNTFQCIDGLQRLTAVRRFMAGEIEVFGGLTVSDLDKSPFDPRRIHLQVEVYEFVWREQLLQFYLDLNSAGSPHSTSEIDRVQGLLAVAKQAAPPESPRAEAGAPKLRRAQP